MSKTIELTQGRVALVDDEDYEWLSKYRWFYNSSYRQGYANRNLRKADGKRTTAGMHRDILKHCGFDMSGLETDHKNHDKLDNRRKNLRPATFRQNQRNRKRYASNTSGYTGVALASGNRGWHAYIKYRGKQKFLGYFSNPEDAARAYDHAALELHSEFATLNLPEEK